MSKIAFLGLGAMGSRMAPHLIEAGHDVVVWNRSPAAVAAAVARGAKSAATPRQAAEGAEFVLTMLTDDDASKAVWMTPESGALAGLGKDAIAIEISTVSPAWLERLAAAIKAHGARLLDAPVVGSLLQAEAAQLIMLVGGAEEAFAVAKPVLDCIAGTLHRVGPQGQGVLMKLAANALLAIQVAAIAETLTALDRSRDRSGARPGDHQRLSGDQPGRERDCRADGGGRLRASFHRGADRQGLALRRRRSGNA